MDVAFSKYSGCGNDFILIDNRKELFPHNNSALIAKLCRRPEGIGADGIVLLENSQQADYRMRIFNADGFEAEMCGNGLRCLKKFIEALGVKASSLMIETKERKLKVEENGEGIMASLGEPKHIKLHLSLAIDNTSYVTHYLDTGVPHAVHFVNRLEEVDVNGLGRKIRFHDAFAPKGANANFVELQGEHHIALRTYERGVEQETLACGTGAAASAIAAVLIYHLKPPIKVETRSGIPLIVNLIFDEQAVIKEVQQTGPASFHFQGTIAL